MYWSQTLLLWVEVRTKVAQTVCFAQAPNENRLLNGEKAGFAFLNEGEIPKRFAAVVTARWRLAFTFAGFGSIVADQQAWLLNCGGTPRIRTVLIYCARYQIFD